MKERACCTITFPDAAAGDIATQATRDALTLHVGGSDETFNLGAGALQSATSATSSWVPTAGLSWTAGDQVCLAMTIEPPTVTSVAISSTPAEGQNQSYKIGDAVEATVTFSQAVDGTGIPQLEIDVGGTPKTLSYSATSTLAALVFTGYAVAEGDEDTDGIAIDADSLALNGGTITAIGHPTIAAHLAHGAVAADIADKVDGIRPTVASASAQGTTLTLEWSEALDTGTVPTGDGGYTLSVDSGTAPTVDSVAFDADDPTVMTLTLSAAVDPARTYTLSYDPNTPTYSVYDKARNSAAAFTGQSVTIKNYDWEFTVTPSQPDPDDPEARVATLTEGGGSITATATITGGGVPTAPVTVQLAFGGQALTGIPALEGEGGVSAITIAAGDTSGSLDISAPQQTDDAYSPPDENSLTATFGGTEIGRVTLTVLDDEERPEASFEAPESVTEGEDITLTVTLSRQITIPVDISLGVTGVTGALSGTPTVLTFVAGQTSKTATVRVTENMTEDGVREVTFALKTSETHPHYTLASDAYTGTVRILDNDTAPGAPVNLRAQAGPEQVVLAWGEPSGGGGQPLVKYQYRSAQGSSVPAGTGWTDVPGGAVATGITVTGLTNNQLYSFEVRAVNGVPLEGAVASVQSTPVPERPPLAPQYLHVGFGAGSMTLQWEAPAWDGGQPVTGYRVKVGDEDVAELGPGARRHTVGGLVAGSRVDASVWAVNVHGAGDRAGYANQEVLGAAVGPPTNLRAAPVSENGMRMSWRVPSVPRGVTVLGYFYELTLDPEVWGRGRGEDNAYRSGGLVPPGATSWEFKPQADETYYWRMWTLYEGADGQYGASATTDVVEFTTDNLIAGGARTLTILDTFATRTRMRRWSSGCC